MTTATTRGRGRPAIGKMFHAKLPPELWLVLEQVAARNGWSLAKAGRYLMEQGARGEVRGPRPPAPHAPAGASEAGQDAERYELTYLGDHVAYSVDVMGAVAALALAAMGSRDRGDFAIYAVDGQGRRGQRVRIEESQSEQ